MVLPKMLYEVLPALYVATAATLTLNETLIRYLPVVLLVLVAVLVTYKRYDYRSHSSTLKSRDRIQKRRQSNLKKSIARSGGG